MLHMLFRELHYSDFHRCLTKSTLIHDVFYFHASLLTKPDVCLRFCKKMRASSWQEMTRILNLCSNSIQAQEKQTCESNLMKQLFPTQHSKRSQWIRYFSLKSELGAGLFGQTGGDIKYVFLCSDRTPGH